MRHDARSCCEFVREFDESVIRAHVHAAVGCKLVERQCDCAHSRCDGPFRLSAAELCGDDIMVQAAESEKIRGHLAVERERASVTCGRSERVLVGNVVCSAEHVHIVGEAFGICAKPEAE